MYNAIASLVDLGNTKGSSHGFSQLLSIYLNDFKILFKSILKVVIALLFFIITTFNAYRSKVLRIIVFFVNFLMFLYLFKYGDIFVIYAIAYIGAFLVLFDKHHEDILKLLSLISILILTFLPLGSAGAIYSSGYMSIWLSTPLFFYYFYKLKNVSFKGFNKTYLVKNKLFKSLLVVVFTSFLSAKAYNISKEAYFDIGSRFEKTHTINNRLAKGIYTKERRAKIINDLLDNIIPLLNKDDYLLIYDNIPMIHFLTETKPYLYNPWVWIYDSNTFEKKLNLAQKDILEYPVVIEQKFNTIWEFSEPIDDYLTEHISDIDNETRNDVIKKTKMLKSFIKTNDYEVVWSNAYFNVYKTNKLKK